METEIGAEAGHARSRIILGIYSSTTFSLSQPAQDRWIGSSLKGRESESSQWTRGSHISATSHVRPPRVKGSRSPGGNRFRDSREHARILLAGSRFTTAAGNRT